MALTARQRNALPRSAFAIAPAGAPRSKWAYPMPTAAQARRAGISESQRQRILRNAASRAAQSHTRGSFRQIQRKAKSRSGGRSGQWGPKSGARRRSRRR